jgi:hypothetical protein
MENAEANERFLASHRDRLQRSVTDHQGLAAQAERVITTGKAQDAAERLRKGEDVPGREAAHSRRHGTTGTRNCWQACPRNRSPSSSMKG